METRRPNPSAKKPLREMIGIDVTGAKRHGTQAYQKGNAAICPRL